MTAEEIKAFLRNEFEKDSMPNAVVSTLREIGRRLIGKYLSPGAKRAERDFLLAVNEARVRLECFGDLQVRKMVPLTWRQKYFDILFIFRQWRRATAYFCDTYETLPHNGIRTLWPKKEELELLREQVESATSRVEKQCEAKKSFVVTPVSLIYLREVFDWTYLAVLGPEKAD